MYLEISRKEESMEGRREKTVKMIKRTRKERKKVEGMFLRKQPKESLRGES